MEDMEEGEGLAEGKPFRLVSKLEAGRAITLAGSNVVIRDRSDSDDQVFVLDAETGSIQPSTGTADGIW